MWFLILKDKEREKKKRKARGFKGLMDEWWQEEDEDRGGKGFHGLRDGGEKGKARDLRVMGKGKKKTIFSRGKLERGGFFFGFTQKSNGG